MTVTTSTPCTECGVYEGTTCRHVTVEPFTDDLSKMRVLGWSEANPDGRSQARRKAKADRPGRDAAPHDGVLVVREGVDPDTLPFGTE